MAYHSVNHKFPVFMNITQVCTLSHAVFETDVSLENTSLCISAFFAHRCFGFTLTFGGKKKIEGKLIISF